MGNLVNLNRLAIELNLPREWLRAEAQAGRLPCLRVGRKLLFNAVAVELVLGKRAADYQEPGIVGGCADCEPREPAHKSLSQE